MEMAQAGTGKPAPGKETLLDGEVLAAERIDENAAENGADDLLGIGQQCRVGVGGRSIGQAERNHLHDYDR